MTKFATTIALAAAAVALGTSAKAMLTDPGPAPAPMMYEAQMQPEVILATARPPSGFEGNWYIAPNGCAYSRAQAPGAAPMWILIQNPHHLGLPNRHSGCASML